MKKWLVFNVGCIECGVSSNVVGLFETEEMADQVAEECSKSLGWRQGGQNSFEVFDLSLPTHGDYVEAIARATV